MSAKRLTPEMLLAAYSAGIFPMAESRDDPEVYWVDPRQRGVIPLNGFHMSRSLIRRLRRGTYHATLNTAFEAVLDGCADREDTWINKTIRDLMLTLHARGHAHSIEVWRDKTLVGGTYGLTIGGAFFGESMFSRETDGSKMALAWTVDHLRRCGFILFDTQFLTQHLASLGAVEITRANYRSRLSQAIDLDVTIEKMPLERHAQAMVQRITQTS